MRVLEDHADRAGDGAFARHHVIRGDRRHVGGGGADPVDDGDDGLLLRGGAHGAVERLAAARHAAARIDMDQDRLHGGRLGGVLQELDGLGPRLDEAVDADFRNLATNASGSQPVEVGGCADDRKDRHGQHHEGGHAPEARPPSEPPALQDRFGVHANSPSAGPCLG